MTKPWGRCPENAGLKTPGLLHRTGPSYLPKVEWGQGAEALWMRCICSVPMEVTPTLCSHSHGGPITPSFT